MKHILLNSPFLWITSLFCILYQLTFFILAPKHGFNPQFSLFLSTGEECQRAKSGAHKRTWASSVGRNAISIVVVGTFFPTEPSVVFLLSPYIYSDFPNLVYYNIIPISLKTYDSINHQDFLSRIGVQWGYTASFYNIFNIKKWSNLKRYCRKFPGSPVVRTRHFHCRECGVNPWSGN